MRSPKGLSSISTLGWERLCHIPAQQNLDTFDNLSNPYIKYSLLGLWGLALGMHS